MIVYAANARQIPTRRYMTGVKEQRAFNGAFPTVVQSDFADGDSLLPAFAAGPDRRHACAADKRELAFLKHNAAQSAGEATRIGTGENDPRDCQLPCERFTLGFEIDGTCKATFFVA